MRPGRPWEMSNTFLKLSGGELLRSPIHYPMSSLVAATIIGMSGPPWAYLGRHWTTTFSSPIAWSIAITATLLLLRSKRPFHSLAAGLCVFAAMCVDLAPFRIKAELLFGVLLAQAGLFAAAPLPSLVRPEKAVLWIVATFVQSVWVHNFMSIGKHISFFGPTYIL
jgi:hypothetical protein